MSPARTEADRIEVVSFFAPLSLLNSFPSAASSYSVFPHFFNPPPFDVDNGKPFRFEFSWSSLL
ncbi:hypothetical protein M413DRAFT_449975 [Hebeloma cylindrosporum]|uniref:Uncharacterized protein n=1 Tax=Hebeloma cylindrosporum TaxID=76867 RepID=A0A0C3BUC1_HEBCY|nr:hypothetical protein M413DRAFT_449975 [Hebeloma cylindrosporum h7]